MRAVSASEYEKQNESGLPVNLTVTLYTSYYTNFDEFGFVCQLNGEDLTNRTQFDKNELYHEQDEHVDGDNIVRGFHIGPKKEPERSRNSSSDYKPSIWLPGDIFRDVIWKNTGEMDLKIRYYELAGLLKTKFKEFAITIPCNYSEYPFSIKKIDEKGRVIQECELPLKIAYLEGDIPQKFKDKSKAPGYSDLTPLGVGILMERNYCTIEIPIDSLEWKDVEPYYLLRD